MISARSFRAPQSEIGAKLMQYVLTGMHYSLIINLQTVIFTGADYFNNVPAVQDRNVHYTAIHSVASRMIGYLSLHLVTGQ